MKILSSPVGGYQVLTEASSDTFLQTVGNHTQGYTSSQCKAIIVTVNLVIRPISKIHGCLLGNITSFRSSDIRTASASSGSLVIKPITQPLYSLISVIVVKYSRP